MEEKLISLESQTKGQSNDLRQLKNHSNESVSVVAQCKQRIAELEKMVEAQNQNIEQIQSAIQMLLEALQVKAPLTSRVESESNPKSYRVKSGDSLEKIAKVHNVKIQDLKELNGLNRDRIIVGQLLKLPDMEKSP